MLIRHIALLRPQRELLDVPRGFERFRAYLDAMLNEARDDVQVPLTGFNPMSKEHVRDLLDALLVIDAEAACAHAIELVSTNVAAIEASAQVGLVVVDDLMGGWTNRFTADLARRTDPAAELTRGFLTIPVWSSEPASVDVVKRDTIATIARAALAISSGKPATLGALLDHEAAVARVVRSIDATLPPAARLDDPDDVEYTREVVTPLAKHDDWPTFIAALYGDDAAKSLGHRALGLSKNAGIALAWSETTYDLANIDGR